jgi:hypothetical protein
MDAEAWHAGFVPGNKTQNIDLRDVTRELPRTVAKRQTKRMVVAVGGGALVFGGIALGAVPGLPGLPLGLVGLAVLAREFHWARRAQARFRARLRSLRRRTGDGRRPSRPR